MEREGGKDPEGRIILPTRKNVPRYDRPLSILVLGAPKAGKTTFLGTVEEALVIDVDKGASFLSGVYVWAPRSLRELDAVLTEPLPPLYRAVCLDSLTMLSSWVEREVTRAAGVESLSEIPYGRGFADVRRKMMDIILTAQRQGRWTFATGHLFLTEGPSWTPEMSGRLRTIVGALFDCIAYLRRGEEGPELVFSSTEADHPEVGSRHPALAGKVLPASFGALLEELRKYPPPQIPEEQEKESPSLEAEFAPPQITKNQQRVIRELYNTLLTEKTQGKSVDSHLRAEVIKSQREEMTQEEAQNLISRLQEALKKNKQEQGGERK